jgi:hypothetical protein
LALVDTLMRWTFAEYEIGKTLAAILREDSRPIIEQLIQCNNSLGQRKILLEHATNKLSAEHLEVIEVLLAMFMQDFKDRNKLVHWMSGYSPQIEDGILLVDPKWCWRNDVALQEEIHAGGSRIDFPKDKIFVYTLAAFERLNRRFEELQKGFWSINWILLPHTVEHAREYARLRALPRYLPTLERLRASQSNPPEGSLK